MVNYGLSENEVRVIKEEASRRAAMRHQFLKMSQSPYEQAKGGAMFDPAILRFEAMQATQLDYFKPTPKTSKMGLLLVVVPMGIFAYILKKDKERQEREFRTGQISYRDRPAKFM